MTSEVIDIADPDVVARRVATWATAEFAGPVTTSDCVRFEGGMDNFVFAIRLAGETLPLAWRRELVVRIRPSADGYEHLAAEGSIQDACRSHGFPAAEVLATINGDWFGGHPVQFAVRAEGSMSLDVWLGAPWRIPAGVRRFARLHAQLHRLDASTWPNAVERSSIVEQRMRDVDRQCERGNEYLFTAAPGVRAAVERTKHDPNDRRVCHADFHPLNIIVGPHDAMTVIDWTDATLDDRHGDVARTVTLLRCAVVAASSTLERVVLKAVGPVLGWWYLRCYRAQLPLNRDTLHRYEAVHLANGIAQIASLSDPTTASAAAGRTFDPAIVAMIQRRLDRTLRRLDTLC